MFGTEDGKRGAGWLAVHSEKEWQVPSVFILDPRAVCSMRRASMYMAGTHISFFSRGVWIFKLILVCAIMLETGGRNPLCATTSFSYMHSQFTPVTTKTTLIYAYRDACFRAYTPPYRHNMYRTEPVHQGPTCVIPAPLELSLT